MQQQYDTESLMARIASLKGITLIELAVTLTIVIVLALISIPMFNAFLQKYRVSTAAENLYYNLQYARSEAVKRNATVYVSFTSGDSWCYGINVGSTCNCALAGNCGLGSVSAPAPGKLTLSTTGLSSNSISFEGTHAATNNSATLTYTVYGQSTLITISVGRLGGLQMCATGLTGYTAC